MRVSTIAFLTCFAAFLPFSGCSEEEELPPPRQTQKIVKYVGKTESEKEHPAAEVEEKKAVVEEEVKATKTSVEEKKPEPAEAEKKEEKTWAVEGGYYVVKKGDTLSSMAARKDIYQDPLKWPLLLRFNLDQVGNMPIGADFAERAVPEGMRLKIVTPSNPKEGLKKEANKIWVVNVLSSATPERVVPLAVTLIKKGYPMYIARANVKGKEWMRLRVGFFASKAEADELGKKITEMTKLENSWSSRVGKEEFEEFGGF